MGLAADFLLTAGPTWCDMLSQDCAELSIGFERGYAHDSGERMQIVNIGGRSVGDELSVMYRPWGIFLRAHRNLYVCVRGLSVQEVLVEIAKWGSTSACLEDLLKQLGVRPWSYGLFSNAGFAMSMLLLRNSGWELLGHEDNLHAYSQFKEVTGEDALDRNSLSEVSSGSTFTLAEEYHFLTDRGTFWLREMELRKLLVSSLSARSSDVRQVYFLSTNHDGFRLDWPIYGGDHMFGLPWPECFLNTSGEIIVISPETGEGFFLKGYLRQIIVWGPELTRRLSGWLPSLKSSQP